jgi:hypothetical protein
MDDPSDNISIINVYTDANPEMAIIAIEKTEKLGPERRFDLIVLENECSELFESDAVRIALTYLPENSDVLLHCDKEGDVVAIKNGKSKNPDLQNIIDKINKLEIEKNLSIEYRSIPRKQNYAGRMLDKIE